MGSPAIFSGNFVKFLKSQLDLFGSASILTGTADPSLVATDAPQGSIYLRIGGAGGQAYMKLDAGSTTNWVIFALSSATTTQSTIEPLATKVDNEHAGVFSEPWSNSLTLSGEIEPYLFQFNGVLYDDYPGSGTTVYMLWSPLFPNPADPDTVDSTGWTAVTAATSITTGGAVRVGPASVQWTKTTAATATEVEYDRGSSSLVIKNQTNAVAYIDLGDATQINLGGGGIYMRAVDTIGGTKSLTVTAATQFDGSPFVTGVNKLHFDFSSPIATGGATLNDAFSSTRFGFITNNASDVQTVSINGLMFGFSATSTLGFKSNELTIWDATNKERFIFPSGSASSGEMTIQSALANSYAAGSATTVNRNMLELDVQRMVVNNTLTGAALTSQDLHYGRILRSVQSGNFAVIVDGATPQVYPVTAVTGSDIDVTDVVDTSADVVNGNTLHVFRPYYIDGAPWYVYVQDLSVTASSWSADVLTITCSTGATAVGDIVVKKFVDTSLSVVSGALTNESYSALTSDPSPNGIQLFSTGVPIPNSQFVKGFYKLGALTATDALANQLGNLSTLAASGGVTTGVAFLNGQYGAGPFSDANYFSLSAGDSAGLLSLNSSNPVSGLIWVYLNSLATDAVLLSNTGVGNAGWALGFTIADQTVDIYYNNVKVVTGGMALTTGVWHQIAFNLKGQSSLAELWVNGVYSSGIGSAISTNANQIFVGRQYVGGSSFSPGMLAQLVLEADGPGLTQSQIDGLYANGRGQILNSSSMVRYQYTANSVSGDKISVRPTLSVTTNAVSPFIEKIAIIEK